MQLSNEKKKSWAKRCSVSHDKIFFNSISFGFFFSILICYEFIPPFNLIVYEYQIRSVFFFFFVSSNKSWISNLRVENWTHEMKRKKNKTLVFTLINNSNKRFFARRFLIKWLKEVLFGISLSLTSPWSERIFSKTQMHLQNCIGVESSFHSQVITSASYEIHNIFFPQSWWKTFLSPKQINIYFKPNNA